MFTDTHCHLYKEYYENLDDIIDICVENKIPRFINNGCDDSSNREVLSYLDKYKGMYAAIGIHPEYVDSYNDADIDFIEKHINDNKVVSVGEIGLDYYWVKDNKEKQIKLFETQLHLAEKCNKPVIVHSRDATEDTINCLSKYKVRGVIHSFSGSYETACIYIKMGFLLGINGVITFKNCKLRDVILKLDLSNFVLETDSPYLTPVPYRGQQNNPSHVMDIAKFICEIKGISMEELSKITEDNVRKVFNI